MIHFACPGCRRGLQANDHQAGAAVACRCGQRMRVPAVAPATPLPSSILTPIPPRPSAPPPPPPPAAATPRRSPRPALLLVGAAAGVLLLVVLAVGVWKGARGAVESVVAPKEMSALDLWRAGPSMKGQRVRVKGFASIIRGQLSDGKGNFFALVTFEESGKTLVVGTTSEEMCGPLGPIEEKETPKVPVSEPEEVKDAKPKGSFGPGPGPGPGATPSPMPPPTLRRIITIDATVEEIGTDGDVRLAHNFRVVAVAN